MEIGKSNFPRKWKIDLIEKKISRDWNSSTHDCQKLLILSFSFPSLSFLSFFKCFILKMLTDFVKNWFLELFLRNGNRFLELFLRNGNRKTELFFLNGNRFFELFFPLTMRRYGNWNSDEENEEEEDWDEEGAPITVQIPFTVPTNQVKKSQPL